MLNLFELLKEYIDTGRIKIDRSRHPELTTIHDPCHYTRKSQLFFGDHCARIARWIVSRCCENMVEMCADPLENLCCGAGGGAWAMPYAEQRLAYGKYKAAQIKRTGAELVIASCHNCRDQIMKSLAEEYDLGNYKQTMYIWELVSKSLILQPWSAQEIDKARALRDAQFQRDGVSPE